MKNLISDTVGVFGIFAFTYVIYTFPEILKLIDTLTQNLLEESQFIDQTIILQNKNLKQKERFKMKTISINKQNIGIPISLERCLRI